MEPTNIYSPNKKRVATLLYESEIRFGPAYYLLKMDSLILDGRFFSLNGIWSLDSRFFAVEEWLTTSVNKGPNMGLVIFDMVKNKEAIISVVNKGFLDPITFKDNKIIYRKDYRGKGLIKEFEVIILDINNWTDIKK